MFQLQLPITDPTWIFFVVLSVILFAPMLLERLRIPSIIGLIAAGLLIGPHGLHLLDRDSSFEIFGRVGLLYIMFLAALEMNLQDVRRQKGKAVGYGLLSFLLPIVIGVAANVWTLGQSLPAALLMASMYAAHTLITYPTVMKMGLTKTRSVSIAVGGTIVADTLTLILLAVVGGAYSADGDLLALLWLLPKLAIVAGAIIWGFPIVARKFFRRYDDSVLQYIFVLALLFMGAGMMEVAGMEGILGAFLVGLVLNREIPPGGPLMSHIEFLGNALFIPYFLIGVGMLVNLTAFTNLGVITIAIVMILCGTGGKWLAAWMFQQLTHMHPNERRLMFGLSSARAAATLAIVLVGYDIILPNGQRMLGDDILNAAMFLILASCIVSSLVTEEAARRVVLSGAVKIKEALDGHNDNILIAISDPDRVSAMTDAALMLRTPSATASLTAINVFLEDSDENIQQGQHSLAKAARISAAANVKMQTHCRWSVNPVTGIRHAAKENDATDILIGQHRRRKDSDTFYGRFAEDLIATVPQQVIIYNGVTSIYNVSRIIVVAPPKGQIDPGFRLWAQRVATLAQQNRSQLTIYSSRSTLAALDALWQEKKYSVDPHLTYYHDWDDFSALATTIRKEDLIVFILAQKNTPWHHPYHDNVPAQIDRFFQNHNTMLIVPASAGGKTGTAELRAGIALEQK